MAAWVYDPHSGGMNIPDRVKERTRTRILDHATRHHEGKFICLDIRFRRQFCYIDAYTEPDVGDNGLGEHATTAWRAVCQ